jgi:excinuclease ABC subunit A
VALERASASSRPGEAQPRAQACVRVVGRARAQPRDVTVEIPLGLFTCVTGVSGSGKSSLIVDTLLPAARSKLYNATAPVGECDASRGSTTSTRSSRSTRPPSGARRARTRPRTPASSRSCASSTRAARRARARYKAGRFSFNVKGGRCEACQGDGVLRVEMHFLPDIFVTCDACGGRRYNRETLEVKYRGLSIADALDVTVEQALELFGAVPRIARQARGAAQGRARVPHAGAAGDDALGRRGAAREARARARAQATGRTLYVLDEPTTGLHFADIEVLLTALTDLRDQGTRSSSSSTTSTSWPAPTGSSISGPEGGEGGGEIVAAGTPEQVSQVLRSHTARYLADVLLRTTPSTKGAKRAARG